MTTRRQLLAGLAAAAAMPARAQAPATLRVSTAAPPSDHLAKLLEAFKTDVEAQNVAVSVAVHPASTLFKQGTEVQALQRGNLEMSTMTTFEVAQQMPELGFLNRGYLFQDHAHLRRVFDGPFGAAYRQRVADKMGIEILATHYLGTRQVGLRQKRPVRSPADLAGVKIRMPAGPEWLLLGRTLGASPVPLGMPEVYLALKTGTIDAQENPLSILSAAKLYEVSEQVSLTSHMLQPVLLSIAKPAWDKLAPPQQAAVQQAARTACAAGDQARLAEEATITETLKGRGLAVEPVDLAQFRANADRVYAESARALGCHADEAGAGGVTRLAALVPSGMFMLVFLIFNLKIATRYLQHDEAAWTDEACVILFVWIVFWANAFLVRDRQQITFDLLYAPMPPATKRAMAILRHLLVGGLFLWSLPGSLDYILFLYRERTPVMELRFDWVYSCFGLFMASVIVRAGWSLVRLLGPRWRAAL